MKLREILCRMLITRKCLLCHEPISYDKEIPFCKECENHWENFLRIKCPKCGFSADNCTCLPQNVRKLSSHGASWCVFYDGGGKNAVNSLVFKLKREYDRDVVDFMTSLMAKNIKMLANRHGIDLKEYKITYTPRRVRVKRHQGFDHVRKLADSLGKSLGLPVERCLVNVGELAQKSLNKKERLENARLSYELYSKAQISGKRYILVDDIITTGATMLASGELLIQAGALDVIPLSYAKNIK